MALNKLSLLSRLSLKISSYVFETPQRKRMPLRGILFLVESARVLETVLILLMIFLGHINEGFYHDIEGAMGFHRNREVVIKAPFR